MAATMLQIYIKKNCDLWKPKILFKPKSYTYFKNFVNS